MLLNPTDRYRLKKYNESWQIGWQEGIIEGKRNMACKLIDKGFSVEKVVEITGLTKECIFNGK